MDPFDVTKYRTLNHWESWSKFGVPRNYYFKGIDLIQLVDNIDYEMRFKANFGEILKYKLIFTKRVNVISL